MEPFFLSHSQTPCSVEGGAGTRLLMIEKIPRFSPHFSVLEVMESWARPGNEARESGLGLCIGGRCNVSK